MISFNESLQAAYQSSNSVVVVPETWGQGRATFGGMVAALVYAKVAGQVEPGYPVRSISLSFVAPVAPGEIQVQVTLLREGRATRQYQLTAYQNDQVCVVMLVCFGQDRESVVRVDYEQAPAVGEPESKPAFPFIPNVTPDFTQHYDYRYTTGKFPFSGSKETVMGGWIRQKDEVSHPVSVAEILALLDAWPPATLSMLKSPAPGSSLTWTISFVNIPDDRKADDWWQYEAHIQQAHHGYSHIDATLWDDRGQAVVLSRQAVCVFA